MTPRHISSRSLGFIIVLWALASPPPTVTGAPPESAKQDAKEETVGPFHFTALDGAPLDDQGYEALSRTVMVRVGGIGDFTSAEFFALHIGNQMLGVRFANTIQPTQENNFEVSGYRTSYTQLISGYRVGDG